MIHKTDLEKIKDLFDSLKIDYSISHTTGKPQITLLTLKADSSEVVVGYFGFFTQFCFISETGKFIEVGIFE